MPVATVSTRTTCMFHCERRRPCPLHRSGAAATVSCLGAAASNCVAKRPRTSPSNRATLALARTPPPYTRWRIDWLSPRARGSRFIARDGDGLSMPIRRNRAPSTQAKWFRSGSRSRIACSFPVMVRSNAPWISKSSPCPSDRRVASTSYAAALRATGYRF